MNKHKVLAGGLILILVLTMYAILGLLVTSGLEDNKLYVVLDGDKDYSNPDNVTNTVYIENNNSTIVEQSYIEDVIDSRIDRLEYRNICPFRSLRIQILRWLKLNIF